MGATITCLALERTKRVMVQKRAVGVWGDDREEGDIGMKAVNWRTLRIYYSIIIVLF